MGLPIPITRLEDNKFYITNPDRADKKNVEIIPDFRTSGGLAGFEISGSGLTTWGLDGYGEPDKFTPVGTTVGKGSDNTIISGKKIAVAFLDSDEGNIVGILLGRRDGNTVIFDRIQDSKGIIRSLSDDKMIQHVKGGGVEVVTNNDPKHIKIEVDLVKNKRNPHNATKDVRIPQNVADDLGELITRKSLQYKNKTHSELSPDMQKALAQALNPDRYVSGTAPLLPKEVGISQERRV